MWCDQGVWDWQSRARSIQLRELKAVRMLLTRQLGRRVEREKVKDLRLWCDNQTIVHIINSMVTASAELMRELRKLKCILDRLGIFIRAEWIPSSVNRYADSLSRRLRPGDITMKQQLLRSIRDGIQAPEGTLRERPLGEHPVFNRHQCLHDLNDNWNPNELRLLCPPVDLITPVLVKLRQTRAPAILLIPDWPRQPWHQAAVQMANKATKLPAVGEQAFSGRRSINPKWRWLQLEIRPRD